MKKMANENRLIDALVHTEDDLISRKALIAEYDRVHIGEPGGARKLMEDAPTVDAVEVVHSHWEWFEEWNPSTPDHPRECEDCGWRCGRCKDTLVDMVGVYWDNPDEEPKLRYCPNCGARMDGDKHE